MVWGMVGMLQQQWRCGWPPLAFSSPSLLRSRAQSPLLLLRALAQGDENSYAKCVSRSGPDSLLATPQFRADASSRFKHPWLNISRRASLYSIRQPSLERSDTSCEGQGGDPLACTLKKCMPYLLLALGAFLACELPAVAESIRNGGGGATALWEGATVQELMKSGWAGLMAGCLHTLTGLDHLAALAPLCIGRAKLESAMIGALWGCGHDAGQIIFGLLFLLLRGKLKMELLQIWASRVIGFTLLAIGAVGLKEAQEVPVSVMAGESSGVGAPLGLSPIVEEESRRGNHRLRTFGTGVVYGLQPDALIMILPALALPSRLAGAAYLGMFLLGTIVAMSSYTAFIGSCGQALQNRLPWITQRLSIVSSAVAIMFGLGILVGEFFGISFIN